MIKAVIFDVDGVILNSEMYYQERRDHFFATKGILLNAKDHQAFIGSNPDAMMRYLFPDDLKMQEVIKQEYTEFSKKYPRDTRALLNPDIKPLLVQLKEQGIRLAIASSGTLVGIHEMLTENQLSDYFELVVSGEMFEESKPNPEIYSYTVGQLGLNVSDCLVVEDSMLGISAAKAAGLRVLALKQQAYEVNQESADARIDSLQEVLKFL